jgi:hypothetical protein
MWMPGSVVATQVLAFSDSCRVDCQQHGPLSSLPVYWRLKHCCSSIEARRIAGGGLSWSSAIGKRVYITFNPIPKDELWSPTNVKYAGGSEEAVQRHAELLAAKGYEA